MEVNPTPQTESNPDSSSTSSQTHDWVSSQVSDQPSGQVSEYVSDQISDQRSSSEIFRPEILAQLGSFRLRVQALTAGMTFGEHASVRLGISTEFQDHRPWEQGNDPKFIDWRVFARTGKLFARRYREETSTAFYFINDFSPCMNYAGSNDAPDSPVPKNQRLSKCEYARCVTAVLAYLALSQRDLAGVTAFNGRETVSLRPSTGESQWAEILNFLESPPFRSTETRKTVPFADVLNTFAANSHRRGTIFILSDLFSAESWNSIVPQLKLLRSQGNEITIFQTLDPDEWEFPFESLSRFVSLDSPAESLTLSPAAIREEYLKSIRSWQKSIEDGARALGIRSFRTDTSTPIHQTILSGTQF